MPASMERYRDMLIELEAMGLAYMRAFNRLRSAVNDGDDAVVLAALADCQPLLEPWTDGGIDRRQCDALWQESTRKTAGRATTATARLTPRTLAPYVPGGSRTH